jgi:UDP-glucose 4-epimerase
MWRKCQSSGFSAATRPTRSGANNFQLSIFYFPLAGSWRLFVSCIPVFLSLLFKVWVAPSSVGLWVLSLASVFFSTNYEQKTTNLTLKTMSMKILITGGAGFIGSHIVEHFGRVGSAHADSVDIVVLDNFRSGFRRNLEGLNCRLMEGSITDPAIVAEAVKGVDYIFHLAAMISVPESMFKPQECVQINTQGMLNVLQAAAKAGVKKLVFSSSAAVYGDNPTLPKTEEMLPEPKSPYAVTKLDGEYYCKMFNDQGWLKTACMRYFNVFGPRQDPKSQYAAAVPIFIDKAVRGEPMTIFGDGLQTRDFVYVRDVVAANVFLAMRPELSGVYNVANGRTITIKALAEKIIALTGSDSEICFAAERPGDIRHSCAAIDKIQRTGFTPSNAFDDGLAATIDFFRRKRSLGI